MYKMPRTLLLWVSLLHTILKCEIALKLTLRVNSFDPSLYVSIHRFYCLALIINFFLLLKFKFTVLFLFTNLSTLTNMALFGFTLRPR